MSAVTPGSAGLLSFAEELRKYWSFDDGQMHTHSWHDRENFIARKLPELLARLAAKPAEEVREWRCFHCGEVFTDAEAAKEHFGPDTEWQAGCIDPLTKDEAERRADQVDMYTELDREREENSRLTSRDYVLSCYERDLAKFFNGAKSVHQAFLVLDSMEGRALAAEEKLAASLSTTGAPKP